MNTGFTPAERFMARLSLSMKFMVLGGILMAPLVYVTWQYRNAREYNVRIAVKEQHGNVYMSRAVALLDLEVEARAAAVRGEDLGDVAGRIDESVAGLDPVVARFGS